MSREVMQMALEALEKPRPGVRTDFSDAMAYRENVTTATNALREALAQPEEQQSCDKQEPVAYMYPSDLKKFETSECFADAFSISVGSPTLGNTVPLFTSPPQRQPLTDEQITKAFNEAMAKRPKDASNAETRRDFARSIEAAHGIKEHL